MKKLLQHIGTILMALLVLFSSLSFGVSKHYCAGEVSEVSYFVDVTGCKMPQQVDACDTSKTESVKKKSCCETKYQFVDGNDFPSKKITTLVSFDPQIAILQNLSFSFSLCQDNLDSKSFFQYHSPPILKNRVVVYESYLI